MVLIFTGHFFDRYKERFFKIHKDSRPVTNREIMKVFFLFNSNYCFYSKEKEENVRGYCYDGMLLGDPALIPKLMISISRIGSMEFSTCVMLGSSNNDDLTNRICQTNIG